MCTHVWLLCLHSTARYTISPRLMFCIRLPGSFFASHLISKAYISWWYPWMTRVMSSMSWCACMRVCRRTPFICMCAYTNISRDVNVSTYVHIKAIRMHVTIIAHSPVDVSLPVYTHIQSHMGHTMCPASSWSTSVRYAYSCTSMHTQQIA